MNATNFPVHRYHNLDEHSSVAADPLPLEKLPAVASSAVLPYLEVMEVHLNTDLEAKLHKLATETGRPMNELVEDVIAGYLDELVGVRETLNNRYDDLKSGRVKPIDGEEAFARLKAKTEAERHRAG